MPSAPHDQHGNPLHGTPEGVAAYDRAVDRLLRFHPDVLVSADELATEHGEMAMGQALLAYLHLMSTDADDLTGAQAAAQELRTTAEHRRERLHAAAIELWLDGDWTGASAALDDVLLQWPADLLALAIGHQLDFFLGDAANLRDRVGRSLPELDPEAPHTGFVRGMHAFGLEESGHYGAAEEAGLAALDINPDDVWAVHAVVHTHEMQGNVAEGLRFMLERQTDWGEGNLFTTHNWWHLALYALEAGDTSRALAVYDDHIHNDQAAGVPIEMLDASALLWRLHIDGVDDGGRFQPLAVSWAAKAGSEPWYAFNDVHAVMAYVGAARFDDARETIDRLQRSAAGATGTNGFMATRIGIPVAEALLAFGQGRYGDTAAGLAPIRREFHRFGGSHAQRDALQRTLLEASMRAGNKEMARALTAERVSARPHSTYNWLQRARALRASGDEAGAAVADARYLGLRTSSARYLAPSSSDSSLKS